MEPYRALLRDTLAEEERSRSMRYKFEKPRTQFVVCRGLLRHIISYFTQLAPHRIKLGYTEFGKPIFQYWRHNQVDIHFSVSHSGNFYIIGVSLDDPLGVDVERIRSCIRYRAIAYSQFAPSEIASFSKIPKQMQIKAFYSAWTRKEAIIKAAGRGLYMPMNCFAVSISPIMHPGRKYFQQATTLYGSWSIVDIGLPFEETYAAIAVKSPPAKVKIVRISCNHIRKNSFLTESS
jgi:4'-phosphopantetheinyl transferase